MRRMPTIIDIRHVRLLQMSTNELRSEDILSDALEFLGGKPVVEDDTIRYGPLILTLPQKVRYFN